MIRVNLKNTNLLLLVVIKVIFKQFFIKYSRCIFLSYIINFILNNFLLIKYFFKLFIVYLDTTYIYHDKTTYHLTNACVYGNYNNNKMDEKYSF